MGKGFTLIETMVAISILTLAIAGPMFVADRSIVAAQNARDQLVATYLAQEGIEHVRAMRDNAYLAAYHTGGTNISNTAWNDFLTGTAASSISRCIAPETCTLDPVSGGSLERCEAAGHSCAPLHLARIYTQQDPSGSVVSQFTRTIQGISLSPNEVKIVSTVSWNFHGTPYSVTVSDHLTSWH